jgi:hypothetical protein
VSQNIVRIVSKTATRPALAKPRPSPPWQSLQRARRASTTPKAAQFAGGSEGSFGRRR